MNKEISILLPCYNESEGLESAISTVSRYLAEQGYDYELIVVDDASTDDSYKIASTLAQSNERLRVHRHPDNQGPCSALRSGPALATKAWTLLLPVDLAIPLEDIDHLWEERTGVDIVLGYIEDDRIRGKKRKFQSNVYTSFINFLFSLQLRQVNYVALYRTEFLRGLDLICSGVALHAEILIRASRLGMKIRQVGLSYRGRTSGKESGNRPSVILKTIVEILKLKRML